MAVVGDEKCILLSGGGVTKAAASPSRDAWLFSKRAHFMQGIKMATERVPGKVNCSCYG